MNSQHHIFRKFPSLSAWLPFIIALFCDRATAQVPMFDFYFGPNVAVLNEIPEHFQQVNADF